ncbi:MAG: LysR substrate-binding domain-containing protein [Minicystis sp.]
MRRRSRPRCGGSSATCAASSRPTSASSRRPRPAPSPSRAPTCSWPSCPSSSAASPGRRPACGSKRARRRRILPGLLAEGAVDLAILAARDEGPGLVQRVLGSVRWCVLARRGHPAVKKGGLDTATWLASPHVVVRTAEGTGVVGRELGRLGHERRVAFVAPSFLSAAHAVAHTDWFFAAPRELVEGLAADLGLVVLDPPIALPAVRVGLVWHERLHADPGHRWLRDLLAEIVGGVLAKGAAGGRRKKR